MSKLATGAMALTLAIGTAGGMALAAEPVAPAAPAVSDRGDLGYRDAAIYSWWQPYLWEGPYDFVITQAIVLKGSDTPPYGFEAPYTNRVVSVEDCKIWNESLAKARAAGKRVFVVVSPGQGRPPSDEYYDAMKQFLDNVDHQELEGICLSEENISEPAWVEKLSEIYHRLKKEYPNLQVYQWYTCSSRADARPGFKWPLLPADGWLSDEYVADTADFEELVRRYRMLDVPFINILWASPFYSSSKQTSVQFHDGIYAGQQRISKKYDVPTGYFVWDGPIGRLSPWDDEGQEENKVLYKEILKTIGSLDQIKDEELEDWDKATIPAPTVLGKIEGGTQVYRESFELWDGTSGQQPPARDFMERADIRGLRNMNWEPNPSRIVIKSDGKKPVNASLMSHWVTADGSKSKLSASAKVEILNEDASAILEVSTNGYDWVGAQTITQTGQVKAELPEAGGEVYTRLRFVTSKPVESKYLGSIDWVEVKTSR